MKTKLLWGKFFFLIYFQWGKKSPFYSHLITRVAVEKRIKFNH